MSGCNERNHCGSTGDSCVSHDGFRDVVRVTDRPLTRDTMHELVDLWYADASAGLDVLADSHLDAMERLILENRA